MSFKPSDKNELIISGKNLVSEALRTNQRLKSIYLFKGMNSADKEDLVDLIQKGGFRFEFKDKEELEKICGSTKNQGVVAKLEKFEFPVFKEMLHKLNKENAKKLIVILDSINDPQNLGSIIRTSATAKVDLIVVNETGSCPINSTVFKVSQGSIFHTPICIVKNLAQSFKLLKDKGFWVWGFESEAGESYWKTEFSGNVALVFGSEGAGLRELTKKNCDFMVNIPISGPISSLNVSVSAALGIFEVLRQRNSKK